MRFELVRVIWFKELKEALRDRRTQFMMVAIPLLLYPMMIFLMSRLQESQEEAQSVRVSRIAVWGELPAPLKRRLSGKERMELRPWGEAPAALQGELAAGKYVAPPTPPLELDAEDRKNDGKKEEKNDEQDARKPVAAAAGEAILARKVDAIAVLWPGFAGNLAQGSLAKVSIYFDSVRAESRKARSRLSDELRLYRAEVLEARERERGLAGGFTSAMEIQPRDVAPPQRRSGMLVGMLLPYMLVIFSVMGGFYAAVDYTAGEKERGTMQTLLCAPLESLEIIAGKLLAVASICVIGTVVNLASLGATFTRVRLVPGMDTSISVPNLGIVFVLLLPVTVMISAIFLAVGAFARDFKEGQSYLTPVLMGLVMTLVVTTLPGIELDSHLVFVPIINAALLVRAVMLAEWRADQVFLAMLSSWVYAALAVAFAARVFERNSLLLGGKETFGSIFDFRRKAGARPDPGFAVLLFSIVLVMAFYGSVFLEDKPMTLVLGVTECGFFLLPALAFVYWRGFPARETLSLRPISMTALLGSVLVGLSAWTIGVGLFVRLLPPPDSLARALKKVVLLGDKPEPLPLILLMVAVTPAICEEIVFRGVILAGFRRLGMWPAVLATAFLFALAHASIYRLLPVLFLGAVLGYAVWKSGSIAAGMIGHAINNGLMAVFAFSPAVAASMGLGSAKMLPWSWVCGGAVVFAAGIWLLARQRGRIDMPAQS